MDYAYPDSRANSDDVDSVAVADIYSYGPSPGITRMAHQPRLTSWEDSVIPGKVVTATSCRSPVSDQATPASGSTGISARASDLARTSRECAVSFPASWKRALTQGVGALQPGGRVGFAVTAEGADYFASTHS